MRRTIALGLVVLAAATGCSRGGGSDYAGLSEYDASSEADQIITDAETDPGSPLAGRHLLAGTFSKGQGPGGRPAWVVSLETMGGRPLRDPCVFVWGSHLPLHETFTYDIGRCPATA